MAFSLICRVIYEMIEVVAIIERDASNFTLAQRPAHSDQAGLWGVCCGGKVEPDESQRQALVRVSYAKNWASKQLWVNMLPAISEKFRGGLSIFMPSHVPDFHGTLRHMNIRRWSGAHLEAAISAGPADIPLLEAFMAYAPPDQRISAGFCHPAGIAVFLRLYPTPSRRILLS